MFAQTRPPKVGNWTEQALRVLRERYLSRQGDEVLETPEEMCWRVAQAIARAEERWGKSPAVVREIAGAFYDLMVEGHFLPNSPTLMNAGKGNQLQYSACYVLPVGDSMDEIFDAVKAAAIIHKSGGGCIAGDARVWTSFCGLEPIEVLVNRATADGRPGERSGAGVAFDVTDRDIHTVALNPETGETGLRRVTHVWRFDVPADLQVLVETRGGTEIQTSAWHPFMVVRPEGLVAVRAEELTPGDVILGPDRPDDYWPYQTHQKVGGLVLDESLGWLVGFTLGDGSFGYVPALRQYRLRWFSGERDVLERVRAILAERDIHVTIQRDRRGLLSIATLTQRFVHDMLEACGLEKIGAKEERVRVPELIAKSPLPVVRAFVAGLIDSDGYVARDGSPSYATVSREMAEDLAGLMSLLGYQPSLVAKPPCGRGKRTVYQVQLCTLPQVNELRADIAPYAASQHKLARLASSSRKQTALRLPFRPWRDRLKRLGLVGSSRLGVGPCSAELNRWSCNPYRRCRRDDLLRIADAVAPLDADLGRLLHRVATRGLEIAAVRGAPEPRNFYDLSVEGWNTYAAGTHGMAFVHNTGFAFSRLRPKDDVVASTGGKASGPVSFLRVFNGATEAVKQGGTRRGANMGILRVDHPDILEFVECKLDGGITNFNISVAATDRFMEALAKGEEYELINPRSGAVAGALSAREVFERIVRAAWRTGDPGMVFIDRINRSPANPTPEVGMVEATNPCVTGDALIYTARGLIRADTLARSGEAIDVTLDSRFDAGEWGIASTVFETGAKPVYRLVTEEGYELRLTVDHLMMTPEGWRRADSLRSGDLVHIVNRKGGFGTEGTLDEGRLLGWLIGDGHIRPDKGVILSFYGEEKRELAPLFAAHMNTVIGTGEGDPYRVTAVEITGRDQMTVSSVRFARRVLERYHLSQETKLLGVPLEILAGSEELQRGFLQALFTADGHVSGKQEKGVSVRLTSISLALLKDVQRVLLNFGIVSRLYADRHPARMVSLPDGKGGTAEYQCQPDHDLVISRASLLTFAREIGFLTATKQNRLLQAIAAYSRGPYRETYVVRFRALEPDGVEPVFDLKEPLTNSFISNGFVVHNCGEQPLLPNEACNLGSLNVARFATRAPNGEWTLDWVDLERVVRLAVRFLDDVIEVNPYPLPEIDATVKSNRRIGLGVMGWADLLFRMGIPYDSQQALELADRLMAFIQEQAHDQSVKLAEERGPFPNWSRSIYKHDRPLRNSTVTTIAPTGTISMIAGCSSGIEPAFAIAFTHKVGDRVLPFINRGFEEVARELGFHSEALMEEVARRGVVHGLDGVPEDVQRVFVTAHEIPFEWHVRHQGAFQRHTDNGVSKTINLPNSATPEDIARAYLLAWEFGCLGITVFRDGCKDDQVLHLGARAKAEPREMAVPGPAVVKPRPRSLTGRTYRIETPLGTAFVVVNANGEGEPFEVFVSVGKAGSDTMAVAEAIGRLISLTLRMPSPFSPTRRLEEIIGQLSGIGGGRPLGFGPQRVLSLPDGIARILAEHIGQIKPEEAGAPARPSKLVAGDICPDCGQATFVYEEGCKKCYSCGFNEC